MTLTALLSWPRFDNNKCAGKNDLFFPDSKAQLAESLPLLRQLCGSCLHKNECLEFALKEEILDGFWGGLTPEERKALTTKGGKQ
jgi:WhiB family redox-sensing transcriptional regulator